MSFNAIRENKILIKNSEFTVKVKFCFFPASGNFSSLLTLADSLDPDHSSHFLGPDLDLKLFDILKVKFVLMLYIPVRTISCLSGLN